MAILSAAEVKTLAPELADLFDTVESYDAMIAELISAVEADFLAIRNHGWQKDEDGDALYPVNAKSVALDMVRFRIMTSLNIAIDSEKSTMLGDSVTYSRDLIQGYPSAVVGRIQRYIGVH